MFKDSTYQEKLKALKPFSENIIDLIKRDLKNEHLKKDYVFVKKYFPGKTPTRISNSEMAEGYFLAIDDQEVGEKVADCVLLFSLDKMEACPIDRWIRRAFENWYPVEENLNYNKLSLWAFEKWGAYAGYAQQYLFHQIRLNSRTESED